MPGADDIVWAKVAEALYKQARDEGWLVRLKGFVRRKHHVLLVGQTGAGKSQLLSALKDSVPVIIDAANRTRQNQPAQGVELAKSPFQFYDTPGDDRLADERLRAYTAHESRKRYGIINVVSFGYHEYRSAPDPFDEDGTVTEEYLATHRALEESQLAEWAPRFGVATKRPWVITAVTKADLWWDRRDEVITHYEGGTYSDILRRNGLRNVVVSTASLRHLFFGRAGTISPSFDDSSMNSIRTDLVKEIVISAGVTEVG